MNEYSIQQALLSQQTMSRFPLMGGGMPWFPPAPNPRSHEALAGATTNLPPFQVSEFIKQAAQQQLQAQLKQHDQSTALVPRTAENMQKAPVKRQMISEMAMEMPDTPNGKKRRGNYASYTPQQRIEIGAYSIECGTGKASKHFGLPESTARGFRDKLIKFIQDNNEPIPLEPDRLARLKILLESGTAQGNAAVVYQETNEKTHEFVPEFHLPWMPKTEGNNNMDGNKNQIPKPIFQPHLDLINSSKSSEEELNVTKSSAGDFQSQRIEELNSDEDSGHSSANSSGNEDAKKNLVQVEDQRVLDNSVFNHSFMMMREKILNQFTQSMATVPANNQDRRRGQFGRYNHQFKLEVAQFAIKEGNSAACRYFNLPESTVRHFKQLVLRKRSADECTGSPSQKIRKEEIPKPVQTSSSPNQSEEANKALRAALYERDNMDNIIRNADDKIDALPVDGTGSGFEGTVRVAGHVAITTAPSDISSIHGNEEERDCSTPNSCSSNGSQNQKSKITQNISINSDASSANSTRTPLGSGVEDISHTEANGLLEQVECALDKVTGTVPTRPSSFTARLLGTLTQTVKFVADCEARLLEESGIRMQLSMQVEQQKKIIDALSMELMEFDNRQKKLENQMNQIINQNPNSSKANQPKINGAESDPVLQNVTQLVNLLRQPGALPPLGAQTVQFPAENLAENPISFSDLADALGDKMTENEN